MFTGLIQQVGAVTAIHETDAGKRLVVRADFAADLEIGESVAVDGACLTVAEIENGALVADVMPETLNGTILGDFEAGRKVNLERALQIGDRLGGHFVQGHVDGVGKVLLINKDDSGWRVEIVAPSPLLKYIAHKGSITINGVSLTVSAIKDDAFEVALIPHTLKETTFDDLSEDDKVNLEVDLLSRYLDKLQS